MLRGHDPLPAVVLNRSWDLVRANNGARLLFGRLYVESANVLQMVIEPGRCGVRCATGTASSRICWNGPGARLWAEYWMSAPMRWCAGCVREPTSPRCSPPPSRGTPPRP
ncbi:hypothetical protein FRAHR75_60095 [Frankia sp. Hr75.2]|nr:hypothetical protein FRAHR75_60095 [Frankia sp. Hr75.2]